MEDDLVVRAHGFQRPIHPFQVLSWIVCFFDVITFGVLILPLVDDKSLQIGLTIFFTVSIIVLICSTARATSLNPKDKHIGHKDDWGDKFPDCEGMPFCTLCAVPVENRSKHCRSCNKCVDIFDHHCMWLNNCIGSQNYRSFATAIATVAVVVGIIFGTVLIMLIDVAMDGDSLDRRISGVDSFKDISSDFFFGLLIVMTIFNAPIFVLDVQLVIMHIILTWQGLTTYDYITNKRDYQADVDVKDKQESKAMILPRCVDWIVFARCGRRRRKQKVASEPPPQDDIAGIQPEPEVLGVPMAFDGPCKSSSQSSGVTCEGRKVSATE